MDILTKYPIDLKKTKIVIAIAQLQGPLPDGKHKTVINDRETLAWKSLDDIKSRLEKVNAILDNLSQGTLKPDIVVFPEYSFPVERAIPELQKRATEYGFIIVGGADSILQPNGKDIYNQSPILLPGHEQPIWVTKGVVSQWEEGLVDEPGETAHPLLTWEVEGREFWISIHICLDFSRASEEFKSGGGLFIVPMCSPDVMSFLGWADNLLRLERGTATVLCNCVGEGAKGQSGLVAVNSGGKPFQAALELSAKKEQVSVFEIDLNHLSPPKKTPTNLKIYPLVRRFLSDLDTMLGGIPLNEIPAQGEEIRNRGVINPTIFSAVLGKKMRMAFLNVPEYGAIRKSVEGKDYEVLAILGKEDLMVTHLADDRYDMIFDVTRAISWIGTKGETVTLQDLTEIAEDNFPHFRVDKYYKVLGVPVTEADREIFFGAREKRFPNFNEIGKIFKLGQWWEDPDVTDPERIRFKDNRWILDTTGTNPGDINAVMTIRLQHARVEIKAHLLAKFEEKIVPELCQSSQVTSLYGGTSPGLGIDYVLRLSIDLKNGFRSLYELIERVHDLSLDERLKADTTTYIVVNRLAHLSLPKAILVTKLPRDKRYRDRRIIRHLLNDERVRLTYQSEKEQLEFVDLFRPVDEGLDKIDYMGLEEDAKDVFLRRLVSGLFNKDFDSLREVHDPLQMRVEKTLTAFIKDKISDEEFSHAKAKESVPSQKDKTQLNYLEKIKIVVRHVEEGDKHEAYLTAFIRDNIHEDEFKQIKAKENLHSQKTKAQLTFQEKVKVVERHTEQTGYLSSVKSLNLTNKVRNAFFHTDTERLTLEDFTAAIVHYCNFISSWTKPIKKEPHQQVGDNPV